MPGACSAASRGEGFELRNRDALPERDAVLDLRGGGHRLGVIPGGVLVLLAADFEAVIARGALPVALAGGLARLQQIGAHRGGGEIMVALDDDRVGRFRDRLAVPYRLDHRCLLQSSIDDLRVRAILLYPRLARNRRRIRPRHAIGDCRAFLLRIPIRIHRLRFPPRRRLRASRQRECAERRQDDWRSSQLRRHKVVPSGLSSSTMPRAASALRMRSAPAKSLPLRAASRAAICAAMSWASSPAPCSQASGFCCNNPSVAPEASSAPLMRAFSARLSALLSSATSSCKAASASGVLRSSSSAARTPWAAASPSAAISATPRSAR